MAPTRELAQQIQKVVIALGDYMGAQCHACIGGTSVREDMRKLDAGQHIVVGKSVYDRSHNSHVMIDKATGLFYHNINLLKDRTCMFYELVNTVMMHNGISNS